MKMWTVRYNEVVLQDIICKSLMAFMGRIAVLSLEYDITLEEVMTIELEIDQRLRCN